jgi:UDP-N-acetyl-D-mannosaminuronic acid dehydrogenase
VLLLFSKNGSDHPNYSRSLNGEFNKILIVGLGRVGLPVAKYVKKRGFDVYGYDLDPKVMDKAEKIEGIKKATSFDNFDVYILCVLTHKSEDISSPQIGDLLSVVDRISNEAKNGGLISIESTIPKGTSRKIVEKVKHRLHVAHLPHRYYALEPEKHGVNQIRVIGGVYDCCLKKAIRFYGGKRSSLKENLNLGSKNGSSQSLKRHLGIPMHPVSEIEIAELSKIIENTNRYLQIAFAEELYLYCQANDINFSELRDALNTKWNVEILEPREGIGGHCLPKDTKMFLGSSKTWKSKIVTAAMEVDEDYQRYIKSKISIPLDAPQTNRTPITVVNDPMEL